MKYQMSRAKTFASKTRPRPLETGLKCILDSSPWSQDPKTAHSSFDLYIYLCIMEELPSVIDDYWLICTGFCTKITIF